MIHTIFPGNVGVLAIGDGFNDIEMFSSADFSI
jgi:hydroxymethylpyrimidine pyrophosphatase-like HAD family hydrolase